MLRRPRAARGRRDTTDDSIATRLGPPDRRRRPRASPPGPRAAPTASRAARILAAPVVLKPSARGPSRAIADRCAGAGAGAGAGAQRARVRGGARGGGLPIYPAGPAVAVAARWQRGGSAGGGMAWRGGTEPWASRGSPAGRLSDAPASLVSQNLSLRLRLSLSLRRRASPAATYVSSAAPARVPGGFRRAALGSLLSQIPGAQSRWPPVRAKPGCRLPAANMLSALRLCASPGANHQPPRWRSTRRLPATPESETARSGASRRRGAPVGGGGLWAGGGLRCAGCGVRFVCSCSTARRQAAIYSRALTFHRDPSARP